MAVQDIFAGHGVAYLAPYNTPLPADADEALNAAFVSLGEVSEDGLAHAFTPDKTILKNWAGNDVRVLTTTTSITFGLKFLEDNLRVVELFYGATVNAGTGVSDVALGRPIDQQYAMVIALADGARGKRYVLPRVEVSEREDKTVAPGEAGWGMTFAALHDPVTGGNGSLQFAWNLASTA